MDNDQNRTRVVHQRTGAESRRMVPLCIVLGGGKRQILNICQKSRVQHPPRGLKNSCSTCYSKENLKE